MSIEALKKILKKDPIIHTFRPDEFVKDPESIDDDYSLHAETHMSIGETQKYLERLITCVSKNKKAFVGGVVGDYGEGKTSIMVYLWKKCEEEKIFAVPPYVWFNFQDHFRVIYSWSKYRIEKINKTLVQDLDAIYKNFREPTLGAMTKEIAERTGANYEELLAVMKEEYEKGKIVVEFSEDDLLLFCQKLCDLVSTIGFKGLIIFNDELELTIEHPGNSRDMVLGRLFKIADTLNNSVGNYGFFIGLPQNEYAIIWAGRRAILDRLEAQKVFVRLSDVYGRDFAIKLWHEYITYFNLREAKNIVYDETLSAIGQVCDSSRKDLGNGPRSVISTFNRMIFKYENTKVAYTPINFIEDCLENEIQLGQGSQLRQKVKTALENSKVKGFYEKSVKLLAAFPNGCPKDIVEKYKLEKDIDELIRTTGWGKLIFKSSEGYALVGLQQGEITESSYLDELLRAYYSHYSAGPSDFERAINVFCQILIESLFEKRQGQQIEGWDTLSQWKQVSKFYYKIYQGTFPMTVRYPNRRVKVIVIAEKSGDIPEDILNIPSDFTFIFKLYFTEVSKGLHNSIQRLSDEPGDFSTIGFKINLLNPQSQTKLGIGVIPENEKTLVPFFALSLIGYLESQEIPKNEEREYVALKERLIKNIRYGIFNEEMRENHDLGFPLDNKGEYLLKELFLEICKKEFPLYLTLISQPQWEKKVEAYVNLMKQEDIPLVVKRGKENWQPAREPNESKRMIAKGFNVSVANLSSWLDGLNELVDITDLEKGKGILRLKVHPLEMMIMDEIEKCPQGKMVSISGKKCKWCDAVELMKKMGELGYLEEELGFIIGRIGPARKLFDCKEHFIPEEGKKIPILYRMPFTPEEYRDELIGKIDALQKEYSYLEAIEGFDKKQDLQTYIQKIAVITEEEQYEELKNELNSLFIIDHKWISIKLEDFKNSIDSKLSIINAKIDEMKRAKLASIINKKIEGQSPWIGKFRELIQENMTNQHQEILKDFARLEKQALSVKNKYNLDRIRIASEGAAQLFEFQREKTSIEHGLDDIKNEIDGYAKRFQFYMNWLQLIKRSDEVFDQAIKIKSSPAYKNDTFLKEFYLISKDIEEKIVKYNIEILKNYESFILSLDELDEACKKFYYGFRESFQDVRKYFVDFLNRIAAPTNQIRTGFDPLEPQKSYEELFESVFSTIITVADEIKNDFINIGYEIRYISDVLKVHNEKIDIIENQLKKNEAKLKNIAEKLQITSIKNEENRKEILEEFEKEIIELREAIRQMKRIHREILSPQPLEEREDQLLQCIKTGQEYNLKEVVLSFRKSRGGKDLDIDRFLELLKELFKKNVIDIKVRRN
jgi:hypothetical protein